MPKKIDITGEKYFSYTVIKEHGKNKQGQILWLCRCDCGNERLAQAYELKRGGQKSCGCSRRGQRLDIRRKDMPEYHVWMEMKSRCYNKSHKNYKSYGGRGITVCERWLNFRLFIQDMGRRPTDKHSLDRYPNNDGIYELSNCRWATMKQQCSNTRKNVWVNYKGINKILSDWAKELNIKPTTLNRYIKKYGVEKAMLHYAKK